MKMAEGKTHDGREDMSAAALQKEAVIARLRSEGCRMTHQRELILEVILEGDYTTIKEIYNIARKEDPRVRFATVCRMVNLLEQIGVASRGIVLNEGILEEISAK